MVRRRPTSYDTDLMKLMNTWILFTLLILAHQLTLAESTEVDSVIATINDEEVVLASDLKLAQKKINKGGFVDEILIPDDETRKKVVNDKQALMQTLIDEKILDSEVKKEKLEATSDQVESRIRTILSRNRITRNELRQALSQQGTSFAEYQEFIKKQIQHQNLIGKNVRSKIQISDDEVMANYLAHRPQGSKENFEYKVSHILFLINSDADDIKAMSQAQIVQSRLKENKSFESLAQEFSQDPRFTAGGEFGDFKTGEMSKEFEAALKGLQVGEVSAPVRSRAGLHLLKLNGKKLISDPQFEAEKEKIRAKLEEQAYQKQFKFWLDQRRTEAIVRVNSK